MNLWSWALTAYGRPGVEPLLLRLQDEDGGGVCLLLWAAWAAQTDRWPDQAELQRAVALARRWEHEVCAPLRQARRALKASFDDMGDEPREALRAQVKSAELQAERTLLEALEAMTPGGLASPVDVAEALRRAAAAWGLGEGREGALAALAAALSA